MPTSSLAYQSIKKVRFNEYDAENLTKMKRIRLEKEKEIRDMLVTRETRQA